MLAEPQRRVLLQAMGVDVYRVRAKPSVPDRAASDFENLDSTPNAARVVAICPRGYRETAAKFCARLGDVLGVAPDRLTWLEVRDPAALAAPEAEIYVVFGAPLARALGEKMSTMQQMRTLIALIDEAPARDGAAKRALWEALKPVARRLRSMD
ncbi:MAG TPA: hypothetical protein VF132_08505 [Rudaea sp.]